MDRILELIDLIHRDQDYHELEEYEAEFKQCIIELNEQKRYDDIVKYTHKLGFSYKYKPYGVKCANVLGYSIFLFNENEGFSFQKHLDFKTELFHCIDNRGYAFLTSGEEYDDVLKNNKIEDWWQGKNNAFDKFKLIPQLGDVIKVHTTGIVHAVIGCTIEEYANTSIDMVNRLFDQNAGRETVIGNRSEISDRLRKLEIPFPKYEFIQNNNGYLQKNNIAVIIINNDLVKVYAIHESKEFSAMRIMFASQGSYEISTKNEYISIASSKGNLVVKEIDGQAGTFSLDRMENAILPPDTNWVIFANDKSDLSVLAIDKERAFK